MKFVEQHCILADVQRGWHVCDCVEHDIVAKTGHEQQQEGDLSLCACTRCRSHTSAHQQLSGMIVQSEALALSVIGSTGDAASSSSVEGAQSSFVYAADVDAVDWLSWSTC